MRQETFLLPHPLACSTRKGGRSQPVKLNIYYLDKCNHVTWVKLGLAIMYVFFNYIDNWDCLPYTISFRLCTIEVVFHSLKWRSSSICLKIKVAFDLLEKCGLFRPVRQGRKEAKWMLSLQANWKDRQASDRARYWEASPLNISCLLLGAVHKLRQPSSTKMSDDNDRNFGIKGYKISARADGGPPSWWGASEPAIDTSGDFSVFYFWELKVYVKIHNSMLRSYGV